MKYPTKAEERPLVIVEGGLVQNDANELDVLDYDCLAGDGTDDDHREYWNTLSERAKAHVRKWEPAIAKLYDDSGYMALPVAVFGIAAYMVYWMIAHGIFHALTALQAGR